jgi:hypothetical protein
MERPGGSESRSIAMAKAIAAAYNSRLSPAARIAPTL